MFKQWIWCLKYRLWPVEELLNTQTLTNFTGGRHMILMVFKAWPTWGWKTVPALHLPSHGPQMDRNTNTHTHTQLSQWEATERSWNTKYWESFSPHLSFSLCSRGRRSKLLSTQRNILILFCQAVSSDAYLSSLSAVTSPPSLFPQRWRWRQSDKMIKTPNEIQTPNLCRWD